MWQAETPVSATLAAELVEARFPELAPIHVELFGEGWDNTAYLVNGRHVFRFPRRPLGVACMVGEIAVLPRLAGRLPWPIPAHRWIGAPTPAFPYPFAGYDLLAGDLAAEAGLTEAEWGALAEPLGAFLRALHGISAAEATAWGAGRDDIGRMDPDRLRRVAPPNLDALAAAGLLAPADLAAAQHLVATIDVAPPRDHCLVHGDVYSRHVLVDAEHRPCGLIDWGDVHCGEPALDLQAVFALLPPTARPAFWRVYGPVPEPVQNLARLRAVHHCAACAVYAHDIGDPHLLREALRGIRIAVS